MKITGDQLSQQVKKSLAKVYLLSGDDPLLMQEAARAVALQAKAQGFSERHLFVHERSFDWQQLQAEASSMSLFAENKLLELRLNTVKIGDKGSSAIDELIASGLDGAVLLITCPKLDAASQRTKWVKKIMQIGVLVQIWPVDVAHLPQWIQQRAKTRGIEFNSAALAVLCDRVEGNLLAATQEIEKLWLLNGPGRVDEEAVRQAISDSARFNVYNLVDYCLAGQAAKATHVVEGLKSEGIEPVLVLWALAREVRTLSSMSERLMQGKGVEVVLNEYRVWERRKSLTRQALLRYNRDQWFKLLLECGKIDQMIKGLQAGGPRQVWDKMLQLALSLSGNPLFVVRRSR